MHVFTLVYFSNKGGCRFVTRKKGVRSPNVLPVAASPKLHRKPWSRGEEKALVQFVCLHEDRKSPLSTAVWPSMNPSDPYWNEAAQYIQTTTGQSYLRTGKCSVPVCSYLKLRTSQIVIIFCCKDFRWIFRWLILQYIMPYMHVCLSLCENAYSGLLLCKNYLLLLVEWTINLQCLFDQCMPFMLKCQITRDLF